MGDGGATSQQKADTLRRILDACQRGDLDDALVYLDPKVVWRPAQEAPAEGLDAVRRAWERWESAWEGIDVTLEECVELGERAVATIHFAGSGRTRGVPIDDRWYAVWTFRAGKVARMDEFSGHLEAFRAVGLGED